jgi:cell wall-associated NlpC family hydrolase
VATFGDRAIAAAGRHLGVTYAWGGGTYDGPSLGIRDGGTADRFKDYLKVGFDCSGLCLYAAYQASDGTIRLPHLADLQRRMGQHIDKGQEQPGDFIAFSDNGGASYHHIGIYLGGGVLRNAPQSGETVKDSPLSNWADEKWEIRRFGEPGSGATTGAPIEGVVGSVEGTGKAPVNKTVVFVAVGVLAVVGIIIVMTQVGV